MWLRDLKEQNGNEAVAAASSAVTRHGAQPDRHGLSRSELDRLRLKTEELRHELTSTVRHIDPAEYSAERIQRLLEQARDK